MSRISRRDAVRHAGALAGGAAVAGPLGRVAGAVPALAQEADEASTLARLIELEQRTALAYREIAEGDLLESEVRRAAEAFARQEEEHAKALLAALEDRGGSRPEPPRPRDVEGLDALGSQRDALELVIDLENALVRAYDEAAETLSSFELLKTCSQIVAIEGQHLVVAREQLGRDPVPKPFEEGDVTD